MAVQIKGCDQKIKSKDQKIKISKKVKISRPKVKILGDQESLISYSVSSRG